VIPATARVLDLTGHRNNVGCAMPGSATSDGLDGFGRTYPAEELRELDPLVGGWPSRWGQDAADNVECDGQAVVLAEPLRVLSVGVLGASTSGSFRDELSLQTRPSGAAGRSVTIGLSDFLAARPAYGETCAVACTRLRAWGQDVIGPRPRLWQLELALPAPVACSALRLPINPAIHVFGLWIVQVSAD
jgi:hypothetical protein